MLKKLKSHALEFFTKFASKAKISKWSLPLYLLAQVIDVPCKTFPNRFSSSRKSLAGDGSLPGFNKIIALFPSY